MGQWMEQVMLDLGNAVVKPLPIPDWVSTNEEPDFRVKGRAVFVDDNVLTVDFGG